MYPKPGFWNSVVILLRRVQNEQNKLHWEQNYAISFEIPVHSISFPLYASLTLIFTLSRTDDRLEGQEKTDVSVLYSTSLQRNQRKYPLKIQNCATY